MNIIAPFKSDQQRLKEAEEFNRICEIQDKETRDREIEKFFDEKYHNIRYVNDKDLKK